MGLLAVTGRKICAYTGEFVEVPEQARVIAGRYQLESLIGEGGMASVWRARDQTLDRLVAVKLLFARDERDKERLVKQFVREARIAASVHHRNVIHIVDFGTTEQQQPFMVMELLEGESLGQRMHREPDLTLGEIVHVALLTLRGLSAVHDAGIIHRDLKPDNVFLTCDRSGALFPKILDFGISRSTEPRSGRRSALTTREGVIVGTPEYMSPEQARGVRSIDKRTDIYSMGCILYEALTGQLPFRSENVGDLIIQIVTSSAPPVHELNPAVPKALSEVVTKAMARAAEDRFQDASEMQEALLAAARAALDGNVATTLSDMPPLLAARQSQERLRTLEFALEVTAEEPKVLPVAVPLRALPPKAANAARSAAFDQTELPEALQPRRRSRNAVLGALALGLAGLAASFSLWPNATREADAVSPVAQGASPQPQPQPAAPRPEPEPEPIETIAVQLRNLPRNATVTVDGVPADGERLELLRDRKNRVIRVTAPGKSVWQAVHHASADGSYEVFLVETARPEPARAASRPKRVVRPALKPAASANRPRPPKRPPSVLRNPDF